MERGEKIKIKTPRYKLPSPKLTIAIHSVVVRLARGRRKVVEELEVGEGQQSQ